MTAQQELRRVVAPLREQVTELLRSEVLSGELAPGTRLVETALCSRFSVSRPLVREALRNLAAEGLVESLPKQGTVVTTLTFDDARDLYEMRAVLEGFAGELFAERASEENRADLEAALARVEKVFSSGALSDQLLAAEQFYDVLLRGAGNAAIRSTLVTVRARIQRLRAISMQKPGRPLESLAELRAITEAALARDRAMTGAACKAHVENAGAIALAALRESASDGHS